MISELAQSLKKAVLFGTDSTLIDFYVLGLLAPTSTSSFFSITNDLITYKETIF